MTVTRPKDLWAGDPVWFSYPCPLISALPLKNDLTIDIAVIGAGVSGATLAQALAEEGYSVAILDKRPPGRGSTSASTALLQYDLDLPLIKLAQSIGKENAERAWLRSKRGLDRLAEKTKRLKIDCSLQLHDSLYLAGNVLDADEMEEEARARNAIGLSTRYTRSQELFDVFGIKKPAALQVRGSLSVDPRRFVAGYLNHALQNRAQLFSPVEITDVQPLGDFVILHTEEGYDIKARFAVFATGYEIFKRISLKNKNIASTWAMATKRQPDKLWPGQVHIWEASEPYLYIRTTADGRVICGGEDEAFSDEDARNALLPEKTKALQKKLKKLFPALDAEAEFSWTGCFGETETGLPMMGLVPGTKNCFAILAFGGNGITFSRIAAEVIVANIKGKEDPDADLFPIQ